MATSNHHHHHHHHRYPLVVRDEAVRLPSIKDLNFHYARRHSQDVPQLAPADHSDTAARAAQSWTRSNHPQSPASVVVLPHQQQHTPPLSANHDPSPTKMDNAGFLSPVIPLSAQSTPVPAHLAVNPAHRPEDVPQPKRQRRATDGMAPPREPRPSHQAGYPPPYAYSHPQPPPPPPAQPPAAYHHISSTMHHAGHPVHSPQSPVDHVHHVHPPQISAHPGYTPYPSYVSNRVHPQHQLQHSHGNPYPSPVPPPAPPPQGPWEQQQHSQPLHVQPSSHPPPPPLHQAPQHQPPQHLAQHPAPQHSQHSVAQHLQHSAPQHQPPPPQHQHPPHQHHQPPPQHQPPHSQHHPPHSQHHPPHPQHQPPPPPHSHLPQHQPATLSHPQPPPITPQHVIPPPQHHHPPQHAAMPPPPSHPVQPQHMNTQPPPPQYALPQQPSCARATPVVLTNVDTRGPYPVSEPVRAPSTRESIMQEIVRHCNILYAFANRYAQMQQTMPDVCPPPEELSEMSHRAAEVVRLLEEYRRLNLPESERAKLEGAVAAITPPDEHDHRPPKRPWEDISQEDTVDAPKVVPFPEHYPTPVEKVQSTAEQDMEIIRSKRATSTAGGSGVGGQPKSKYRKRSRATPPGKCHSCNIRETPEWRRGPDGARTLCNACGLHYAKLQRKRDKIAGSNGEAPPIDIETLRASARAVDMDKTNCRKPSRSQPTEPTSPLESDKTLPHGHHQGSFQLFPVSMAPPAPPPQREPTPPIPEPVHAQPQAHQAHQPMSQNVLCIPPPPWSTSGVQQGPPTPAAPVQRNYAPEQMQHQHQSYLRTPHPNNTSPR